MRRWIVPTAVVIVLATPGTPGTSWLASPDGIVAASPLPPAGASVPRNPLEDAIDVDRTIRVAWEQRAPYARSSSPLHSTSHLDVVGIDVDIVREAFRRAGIRPEFVRSSSWQESLDRLARGEVDAVMGAFLNSERLQYGVPGSSYRNERLTLFLHESTRVLDPPATVEELMDEVANRKLRLGVPIDFFLGEEFMAFEESHADLLRVAESEIALADAASEDRIDAFIADWFSGHDAIRLQRLSSEFAATDLVIYDAPVHTLFRRSAGVSELVTRYDRAIAEMTAEGRIAELNRQFAMPSMLAIAMTGSWFDALDALGTVAFALSGVVIARRERFSVFGAIILAGLPAIGGGALRDILVARYPLGIFESHRNIWLLLGTVAAGYVVGIVFDLLSRRGSSAAARGLVGRGIGMIEICDAVGLASFTITGMYIAMVFREEPLIIWGPFLGAVTAAGGGVLRDVVREGRGQPTLTRSLYAELSILGAAVFVLWAGTISPQETKPAAIRTMIVAVMVSIFVARLLVLRYRIPSPLFSPVLGMRRVSIAEVGETKAAA